MAWKGRVVAVSEEERRALVEALVEGLRRVAGVCAVAGRDAEGLTARVSRHVTDYDEWCRLVDVFGLKVEDRPGSRVAYVVASRSFGPVYLSLQTEVPGLEARERQLAEREAAVARREAELGAPNA